MLHLAPLILAVLGAAVLGGWIVASWAMRRNGKIEYRLASLECLKQRMATIERELHGPEHLEEKITSAIFDQDEAVAEARVN